MTRTTDSPRWCETCKAYGDHHTDRHAEMVPELCHCGKPPYTHPDAGCQRLKEPREHPHGRCGDPDCGGDW